MDLKYGFYMFQWLIRHGVCGESWPRYVEMLRASPHLRDIAFWLAVPLHTTPPQCSWRELVATKHRVLHQNQAGSLSFPEKLQFLHVSLLNHCLWLHVHYCTLIGSLLFCSIHIGTGMIFTVQARNAPDDDAGSASGAVEPQKLGLETSWDLDLWYPVATIQRLLKRSLQRVNKKSYTQRMLRPLTCFHMCKVANDMTHATLLSWMERVNTYPMQSFGRSSPLGWGQPSNWR